MKKAALTAAMLTVAAGASTAAASEPVCYVETTSGRVIDLTALCGSSSVVSPISSTVSPSSISPPEMIRYRETVKTLPSTFSNVSFNPTDSFRKATSDDRWQRAARSVAAAGPYWSGYCHVGNQPCHVLSKTTASSRSRSRFTPYPLIRIIEIEAGTLVLIWDGGNCERYGNGASSGRRCRRDLSEFREVRL